jgi:hypothetical protein
MARDLSHPKAHKNGNACPSQCPIPQDLMRPFPCRVFGNPNAQTRKINVQQEQND